MTMNVKWFKKNVRVHGSDIRNWPEDIRQAGLKALDSSLELRTSLADEERLEKVLKTRKYEEPSKDLAQRIISASLQKKRVRRTVSGFFPELLWELRIGKQARAAVCVSLIFALIIGFAIGFSNPTGTVSTERYHTNLQEFLYYEGEVL